MTEAAWRTKGLFRLRVPERQESIVMWRCVYRQATGRWVFKFPWSQGQLPASYPLDNMRDYNKRTAWIIVFYVVRPPSLSQWWNVFILSVFHLWWCMHCCTVNLQQQRRATRHSHREIKGCSGLLKLYPYLLGVHSWTSMPAPGPFPGDCKPSRLLFTVAPSTSCLDIHRLMLPCCFVLSAPFPYWFSGSQATSSQCCYLSHGKPLLIPNALSSQPLSSVPQALWIWLPDPFRL